ncbi:hypothetical protein AAII07_44810 [Microvirga sp. 0TCS3.31]
MHHPLDLLAASTHSSRRIDGHFKHLRRNGGMAHVMEGEALEPLALRKRQGYGDL